MVINVLSLFHGVTTLPNANINFRVTFILSSANVLELDKSKVLSFGKELNNLAQVLRKEIRPWHSRPAF